MVRKTVLVTMMALTLLAVPGCLGRFALTGGVRKFNLSLTEDKWGREIIFVALYIIPVYPIAGSIDLFIVNSLEFWTETNPIDGEPAIVLSAALSAEELSGMDVESAVAFVQPDGSLLLRVVERSGESHDIHLSAERARDLLGRDPAEVQPGLALRAGT